MQLTNWVLMGKLQYWFQGLCLLKGVLKVARKIIYQFIWAGRKGMTCSRMTFLKVEVGLGLWDLFYWLGFIPLGGLFDYGQILIQSSVVR